MQNQFSRTQLLLGKPAIDTLNGSRVAVFGVGGVGGYVVEVLARSGVGAIDIIDDDRVCLTNVNRQILATISTVGKHKVDVAEARIHDINPRCIVRKYQTFYLPEKADMFDFSDYDYVVDCIDTVTAKLDIIQRCHRLGIPIISCLGAAYKLDATKFEVTDLFKTKMDPLAKVLRKKLRKTDVDHLKVVYSPEEPLESIDQPEISCRFHCICPNKDMRKCTDRHTIPSSNAWVPATAGLICGGEVVKDLVARAHTMRIDLNADPDNEPARIAKERATKMLDESKRLREEARRQRAEQEQIKEKDAS
ncbi:tRNA threonylcarbamoyladenosine dehydratase [uncultured Prevotella sp.]|uniref:tRNA threonylcarbamoyladenosine dehydratase n=1 Tax=uncultured Prevotella sp. TaxID=159272 RepID=UPI002582CB5A|nr:tRNA threonylcarbamoyladenosine dehydratase [uncultured Prevotella sp.]MDY6266682.1 tRNA threonylcarbamoyladenosine dehydratase [Prevotella sp.]